MLLGFKRQFHGFVVDGSKTHTIRATRKIPPRVGQSCDCYADARQKTMRLLGRCPCVAVQEIRIWVDKGESHLPAGRSPILRNLVVTREQEEWPWCVQIDIDGQVLDRDEREALAFRDGFRSSKFASHFEEMVLFWRKEHAKGKPLEFRGHVIHWKYGNV